MNSAGRADFRRLAAAAEPGQGDDPLGGAWWRWLERPHPARVRSGSHPTPPTGRMG